jgi:dephospho-CoA kinase
MRQLVFDDPTAKARLERILHPLIRAEAESAAARADSSAPYIVFAVPLLVESGSWVTRVDRVLVVDCPVPQQIERVVHSRSLPRTQVESIVAQQATRAQRLAAADDVIVNAGPIEDLAPRAARLHAHYCALARQKRGSRQSL